MHEIMRLVLVLFGIKDPKYEPTKPCGHNNRVLDSESHRPVRVSFAWAGGPPLHGRVVLTPVIILKALGV